MDLEYSPNILDTPSLVTPNITLNQMIYRPTHTISSDDGPNMNNNNNNSTSNSSSTTTTTTTNNESLTVSTAEINVSQIEHDLRQSFSQRRQPTESPFQRIVGGGGLTTENNIPMLPTTDDGIPVDVPSTAEVMNDIESYSKYSTKDNSERETTTTTTLNSDNNHFDTSPTHNMGVIVSPKKKLLIRSQSHTEPTSPPNNISQSQRNNFDDDTSSTDDDHTSSINNHFQRVHDLPTLTHPIDTKPQLNNHLEPSYTTIQLRTDQNGILPTVIKQQPMTFSNKRTLQQTMIGAPIPKANSILISQQPFINEVTSSDPLIGMKRQKMTPMPTNTATLRPTSSSTNNNNNNNGGGSDDQRKKQIRDSNREAARRCRERRRNYIEQLEGSLEQYKTQLNKLSEKVSRAERENTQLRAIITEAKIFPSSSRLSLSADFTNAIITSNGIDLNSDSTDGNIIPRSYTNRNTH